MRKLALLALLWALAGAEETGSFQRFTVDWRTPTIPVPTGIAVADTPVVLFCHRRNGRDAVEFMQRNLGDFRTVTYGGYREAPRTPPALGAPDHFALLEIRTHPEITEKTASYIRARLREMLRGAGMLCLDARAWEAMTAPDRDDVRARVEAGLALWMPAPRPAELADLEGWLGKPRWQTVGDVWPQLQLPAMVAARVWQTTAGRGRVCIVEFPRTLSVDFLVARHGDRDVFNQSVLLSHAALLATAARTTPATVADVGLDSVCIHSTKAVNATVEACVTDDRGEVVAAAATDAVLVGGDTTVPLDFGHLPAGTYTVYVQGAEATGAAPVTIDSPTKLTIAATAPLFGPGDPVGAQVTVENAAAGDSLTVSLVDWWGRELVRRAVPAVTGEIELAAPGPRSRYQELRAVLASNGTPQQLARVEVNRYLPHPVDQFQLFFWNGSYDRWWAHLKDARLAALGENCAFSPGSGNRYLIPAIHKNLELFSITHTAQRTIDKLCDPEFFAANVKKLGDFAAGYAELGGAWAMSHGDELYIRGWVPGARDWRVEPAHSALLAYLQRRYDGDIARLNAAWGTAFADFATLEIPDDLDVPKEPRAPWLDYCFFLEDVFCGYFERLNGAVNQQYPEARFGIDGIEKFSCFDGINWPRLQAASDVMIIYPHIDHDNKLYSWRAAIDFKEPGAVGGFWLAYDSDFVPAVAEQYPWLALFNGLGSIGYFQTYETSDVYSALYPDWRPRPAFAATSKAVLKIRDTGADKLLLNATCDYSPIAIHYSPRSLALSFPDSGIVDHVNQLGTRTSYRTRRAGYIGHTANAATAWMMLLADAGYKPRFVDTTRIEAGALADYKVLVLPLSQSLTDGEVAAVDAFVRGGGLVVADYHCGIRDGNGNRLPAGSLDAVLGVHQPTTPPTHRALTASDWVRRPPDGRVMLSLDIASTLVQDAPEQLDGVLPHGDADGGIPVFFSNTVGDGLAVYLGFSVEPYIQWRHSAAGLPLRTAFLEIVRDLGRVGPVAAVVRAEPGFAHDRAYMALPEIGPQFHPFRDGAARYLGILWDYKRDDWTAHGATVRFTTPAHVYNVLTGEYRGFTVAVPVHVEGCPNMLFAQLPYRVAGVAVTPPDRAVAGRPVTVDLAVRADTDALAAHTLRVRVQDAAGNAISALDTTVRAPAGKVAWTFVPAVGETGKLTITARDAVSGLSGTAAVTVEPAP